MIIKFALSAAGTGALLYVLLRSTLANVILDQPNRANAMHALPIPRIGGIVIMAITILAGLLTDHLRPLIPAFATATLLSLISLFDDRIGLSALLRLLTHFAAALLFTSSYLLGFNEVLLSLFMALVLLFAITWSTNLYNFMDGADGLAGGMAVFGFGAYAIAAGQAPSINEAVGIASISAILSGAALGFLFFNFPPAKVFMGDAGSIPLGFLAATLGIQGTLSNLWPWWFPLLVFSPFIVDATVTLTKRIVRFEKIWQAHRKHYYHRLILGGWSHRRTALAYYALMILCGASALFARSLEKPAPILAFWVVTYVLLLMLLEWRFEQKNRRKNKNQ